MKANKLFFIILIFLASCAPQVTAVPTVTVTLPPPTATIIPTPTLPPAFLDLQSQIAGNTQDYTIMGNGQIEGKLPDGTTGVIPGIKLNPDGQGYTIMVDGQAVTIDASDVTITDEEGVQVAGYENLDGDEDFSETSYTPDQLAAMNNAENAKYDAAGLHITLENGEVVTIGSDKLEKSVAYGQDNVIQIRDEANENVLYAYDKETNTFLDAAKYIQKDNSDPEKFIQAANWDEVRAIWAKEKMFMIPFDPDNTYFPLLDKIYLDYENWSESSLNEYSYTNPFGSLPSGMDEPFEFENYVRMARDTTVIGSTQIYFVSQKTFNPDDKSFSVLHSTQPNLPYVLQIIQEQSMSGKFNLPRFTLPSAIVGAPYVRQLESYGLETNGADMPEVGELTYEWLTTGHVPPILEEIPIFTISMHY